MKKIVLLLAIQILAFCIFSRTNIALAQETEVNLTVSPPVSYLHVAPGSSANHTIILENTGTAPITVLPTLVDFTTDGKSGRVIVTNQLTFPYISLGVDNSVKEVTIPPQKKAQLTLYIDVPKEAEEKEYPMTVLFFSQSELEKTASQNTERNTNSSVTGAIGSNLVVLVAKQNKFAKILEVLDANTPKIVDSFQKISFTPIVKNNSFGATTASGSAKIVNWRKQTVAEFQVYPDTILGHNSRELRALLSNSDLEKPEVGSFSFKPQFSLGPYQIVITLTDENNSVITQFVTVYYAVPIAIVLAIILGVGISIYFRTKHKIE